MLLIITKIKSIASVEKKSRSQKPAETKKTRVKKCFNKIQSKSFANYK